MKATQELFDFLVSDAGGESEVYLKFYKNRIGDLGGEDKTVQELFDAAEEGEWHDWLMGLKLNDLANAINPFVLAQSAPSDSGFVPAKRGGSRMTGAERDVLHENVLVFVAENPKCSSSEIAASVGFDTRKLGIQLKKLREAGKLDSEGERISMRYFIPAEEKPAAKGKK